MAGVGVTVVTGGSGFLGSHVVRALAARGDELRLLARRSSKLDHLSGVDFERVTGDVTDRRAVRRALDGAQRVFHVAGRTSLRSQDRASVFETNVRGTRLVLEEALEAGAEGGVHTSSVGAIGVARRGGTADETSTFNIAHLGLAYPNSKHEAELEALRLAARGLRVVIVNPSFVLGPDDPTGTSNRLVSRFLAGAIPAYADGALNIVDVRDVARGHLLADEKGRSGERYILGGRNFTLDRLFADLARIAGVPAPALRIPAPLARLGADMATLVRAPLPVFPDEIRSATLWWTYRNTKARRELGFEPRPHEETLEDAVRWQLDRLGDRVQRTRGLEDLALRAVGRALRVAEGVARR